MNIILMIITICIYIGMILNTKKRTATALLGAGTLLMGTLTSSFDVAKAFSSFPSGIILLIVLSLFTDIFERCGVMNRISYKFVELSKGSQTFIILVLPLIIFFSSLFMNNLSVVLLFTYTVIYLANQYHICKLPLS